MSGHDLTDTLSRRGLLQAGSAAVVGAVFADLGAIASAATPTAGLPRSRFAPHVGQTVSFKLGRGRPFGGRLVGVEDVAVKALAGSEAVYVLRFRARRTSGLGEHITTVRHPRFGSVQLLMIEGAAQRDGQDYLAVVNRHVPR